MAAAAVMVVSSSQRHDRPKLAPKPSPAAKQLDTVRQASQPPQPPPLRSPLSRLEFFGATEAGKVYEKRPDHRCVNQTSTCRNSDHRPVNIDHSVILRRGRRAKAPKPLPYLEPIVTYLAVRSDRQQAVGERSPSVVQQRIRKRVTFAAPARSRPLSQRRVARAHSARGRRKELAYLVVDLESGTITSCSEEQSGCRAERGGTSLRRSVTVADHHSRERAMSTGAASKPVPLPRRIRKVASPAEKDCTTPAPQPSNEDQREKSTISPVPLPRSPVEIPTPEREVEEGTSSPQTPSTADSSRSGRSESLVSQRKMALEKRESSPPRPRSRSTTPSDVKPRPRSQSTVQNGTKPPPPPPVRTCSILTYNASTQQSQPPVSDSQPSDAPSTPPSLPPKSPPHHAPTFRPKSPPHHAPSLPPKSPPHHAPTFRPKSPPHHAPSLPPKSPPHHVPTLPPKSPPHHSPPPPGPDSPPPPIPAKSELSRLIQSSIKGRREPPSPPKSSNETPDPLEITESVEITENYSYGATVLSDGSSGGYEISDPDVSSSNNPDMEEDRPEDLYIDPTLSTEFYLMGKPRPPRPPPPSSSAIKKAQWRKAKNLATSTATLKNKQLTKQRSCSDTRKTSTIQQHRSKSPLISSRLTTACSRSQEDIDEQLYEEVDIESSLPQAPILWRPPSALNASQSVVAPGRGTVDTAGAKTVQPIPSLPPRAEKPTTARKTHRPNDQGAKKTSPGEVTRGKSIGDLHTPRIIRQVSPAIPIKEDILDDLELDSADEYEPLEDTPLPVAPQRTKKNIKGTLKTSPNRAPGNIYNQNSPQNSPQSGTRKKYEPRRTAPVAPAVQKNREEEQRNKSPQMGVKTPPAIGRRKSTGQGKSGRGNNQSGQQNLKDEGGVEDYVDMDYRSAKDGDEDGPDVYVDMQPNKKTQEVNDELSDPLRPYLRT